MNNVDWKKDCQFRKEFGGYKLWSRWCNRFRSAPTKFQGAKQEWIVEFPNGDSCWALSKSKALYGLPAEIQKVLGT